MSAGPGGVRDVRSVEEEIVVDSPVRPAWSQQFTPAAIRELIARGPIADLTPEWAWGGSTGRGVRVAVVDGGVEHDHPALGDSVRGGVVIEFDPNSESKILYEPDEKPQDLFGHGTACAGILHAIAPQAEIYSVRVLGRDASGRGIQFAAGLDWAVQNGMHLVNMSLSTSREEYFALFHHLTDDAYFKNVVLVAAVNNTPEASYPSTYSSVISVAAHEGQDPFNYYYRFWCYFF